jgi:hypothetical protein
LWKDIKAQVPDATLDIYYGWNLYDKSHANNPQMMKWKDMMVELNRNIDILEEQIKKGVEVKEDKKEN